MAFVQFTRVSLAFADRDILKEVSLNLASGSRAALAGANGSGKSTLMKVIAGKLAADSGERAVQKGSRISYLPQSGIVHRGRTLREEAETAYGEIIALLGEIEAIEKTLEGAKADDSRTVALLAEYHRLREAVENSGYYSRDQSIAVVLSGLGFSPDDPDRPVEEFSGGWQMRIALAKALLEAPDILLLDEPTNYLDIEARTWLEQWLRNFTGGCLLVSHDRYFLDVTVNEVYELFQGQLKRYAGNYTAYEQVRQAELENLLKRYAAQQEEIAKAEDLIRRFRYKATKAAMVQERIKKLEKMERIEIPESLKRISIRFPPPPHSGRIAMTLEGIGKNYGDRPVLGGIDLTLEAGEKLVVVGRNGAGKTTLLRILAGEDRNFAGKFSYGAGIRPGYFPQDAAETMYGSNGTDGSNRTVSSQQVLEYLEAEAPTERIPRVRDMLGAFLFRGDDVYKSLSVLSGGEKSRLALLRMLLKPMNLLILDEPTNHLDLHSKDILLDTLRSYTGTIVFVSHDRAFMEALSTKTLELSPRRPDQAAEARLFYGDYGYYLDRIARESSNSVAAGNRITVKKRDAAGPAVPAEPAVPMEPAGRNSLPGSILIKAAERRELSKQRQTIIRRLEREEGEILKALEELEVEKAALETDLARPEVYSSGEKARAVKARLDRVTTELEGKGREWEATAAELGRAKGG